MKNVDLMTIIGHRDGTVTVCVGSVDGMSCGLFPPRKEGIGKNMGYVKKDMNTSVWRTKWDFACSFT